LLIEVGANSTLHILYLTSHLFSDIIDTESEGIIMKHDGKKWYLIDDPICDVENWSSVPVDCQECELFYDCYEINNDN